VDDNADGAEDGTDDEEEGGVGSAGVCVCGGGVGDADVIRSSSAKVITS